MTDRSEASSILYKEVWLFLISILILNAIFVTAIAMEWLPRRYFADGRLYLLVGTLVGAIVVMRGPRTVIELVKPLLVVRFNWLWFFIAMFWPIVFSVTFVIVRSILTGDEMKIIGPGFQLFYRDGFLLNIFILALIGEIVWVGYCLKNLSKFHSLVLTALIVGTFWSLWWTPMMYHQIGIVPNLEIIGLTMNMIGIAFFCGFFYTLTGSGLPILFMQFCFNNSILAFPVLPGASSQLSYQIYSGLYMLIGMFCVVILLPYIQRRRGMAAAPA
ncbi:MAG: CPBP family glutamic-type intramembrane protease [Pseudomonadota bacterium]